VLFGSRTHFAPAERAAAHIVRLEARFLGQPRHDRIERDRRDDELIAPDELTQCLQWVLLRVLHALDGQSEAWSSGTGDGAIAREHCATQRLSCRSCAANS